MDAAAGDEEEDEGAAGAGGDGTDCQKGRAAAKKKTRVDRNRERRRREADVRCPRWYNLIEYSMFAVCVEKLRTRLPAGAMRHTSVSYEYHKYSLR